ncbi:MAG TPA: GNAT family N-acetyltransferase [Longimicrobiales bacterium]
MNFRVVDNVEGHRFEADVNGMLAVAQYRLDGRKLVLTHTEVPAELRGQGIAEQLAETALTSARERNLRVVPLCRFMARYIQRHPEHADLVDDDA